MRVIVFGADGKTGKLVVQKASAAGHVVTAFTRHGQAEGNKTRVVTGDASDAAAVERALAGQDAVIDTIGGRTPYKHTDLETSIARNIIRSMQSQSVRRLIAVSALGVSDSIEQTPFWYEYLLLPTFLRGSTQDKNNMEAEIKASGLEFIIVRPSMLTEDPETGSCRIVTGATKAHKITRGDLAQFLVSQLDSNENIGSSVVVTNT